MEVDFRKWERGMDRGDINTDLLKIMVAAKTADNLPAMVRASAGMLPGLRKMYYLPPSAVRSGTILCEYQDVNMLFCRGMDDGPGQQSSLLSSWRRTGFPRGLHGELWCFAQAAGEIYEACAARYIPLNRRWYCVGHSYGGAIATAWSVHMRRGSTVNPVKCWTYGAPRPGTVEFQQYTSSGWLFRCARLDDPVQFIPPHRDETPAWGLIGPAGMLMDPDGIVQARGGVTLHPGGRMVYENPNKAVSETIVLDIAAWLTNGRIAWSNPHSLEKYLEDFAGVSDVPTRQVGHTADDNPDRPFTPTRLERRRWQGQGERYVLQALRDETPIPMNVELRPLADKPNAIFRWRRWGLIHTVEFDGEVVAVFKGKREAKNAAKAWNQARRSLAHAAVYGGIFE